MRAIGLDGWTAARATARWSARRGPTRSSAVLAATSCTAAKASRTGSGAIRWAGPRLPPRISATPSSAAAWGNANDTLVSSVGSDLIGPPTSGGSELFAWTQDPSPAITQFHFANNQSATAAAGQSAVLTASAPAPRSGRLTLYVDANLISRSSIQKIRRSRSPFPGRRPCRANPCPTGCRTWERVGIVGPYRPGQQFCCRPGFRPESGPVCGRAGFPRSPPATLPPPIRPATTCSRFPPPVRPWDKPSRSPPGSGSTSSGTTLEATGQNRMLGGTPPAGSAAGYVVLPRLRHRLYDLRE